MKKNFFKIVFFIFAFFVIINCAYAEYVPPKPVGYVNDFADVISPKNKGIMQGYIKDLQEKTGAEVTVVTLKSLDDYPIEDVGLAIGRTWGVGQKGKNNGLLVIVAPVDRKMRIEVGYGLEGIINDAKAGEVRDEYMIPYFKKSDYSEGITNGTVKLVNEIAKGYNVTIKPNSRYTVSSQNEDTGFIVNIIILLLGLMAFGLAYIGNGFIFGWTLEYFFTAHRSRIGPKKVYDYWGSYSGPFVNSCYCSGGYYGGSSGFSGGFGGFGGFSGGSFGGGGCSGGW